MSTSRKLKDPNDYGKYQMRLSESERLLMLEAAEAEGFTRAGKPSLATWIKHAAMMRIEELKREGKI
ncbi:hypothetical protein ACQKDY_00525 [Alteromonas macleodii]|uniref:hypothetical protein n=1 Tax=Alteromonas macleodii TaxID=28108 RepID=UPI003D035FA4